MERILDAKGRWRNRTVGFRVSEEEAKLIDTQVALSGLTKQDYIIRRLQCRDVVVQGSPRVYKALRNQMADIDGLGSDRAGKSKSLQGSEKSDAADFR